MIRRGFLLALVWWVLGGGSPSSWWIGVPAILLALWASVLVLPRAGLVWHELLRFAPSFLVRSLLGATDVAWRALHPGMPIAPDLIEYRMKLPSVTAQVFMANVVSLLPGTLSAAVEADRLTIHVLDGRKDCRPELEALEQRVARIFAAGSRLPQGGT